jgi:hypothetical protein
MYYRIEYIPMIHITIVIHEDIAQNLGIGTQLPEKIDNETFLLYGAVVGLEYAQEDGQKNTNFFLEAREGTGRKTEQQVWVETRGERRAGYRRGRGRGRGRGVKERRRAERSTEFRQRYLQ